MAEQAVIVRFGYTAGSLDPLYELEERLIEAVANAEVGEYDGYEMATNLADGTLYLYGPDADALFATVSPLLAAADCLRNALATVRYGPPEDGVRERVVAIDAEPGR